MTEELSPELRSIVAAERSRPGAPPDAKELARARLASMLGPAAGLGASSGSGGAPVGRGSSGTGSSGVTKTGVGAASTGGAGLAKLAGAFVLGGTMTAGVLSAVRPPERETSIPHVASTLSPPIAGSVTPTPAWTAIPPPPVLSASSPPALAPVSPPATRPSSPVPSERGDRDLAGERVLLERARSALARGDGAQALAALDQHARAFKSGQLAEEREALSIQALVALDRQEEAKGRAARFRAAYPHSVFLSMIDEVLR